MNLVKDENAPAGSKEILLTSKVSVRSLGGTIPIVVCYANRGTADISFREPAKTWSVHLLVWRPKQEPQEEALGQIFHYKSDKIERRTIERAETIRLAPGEKYEFDFDPGLRWPELFTPGINLLRLKDRSGESSTVLSNTVEIRVVYDRATFPRLLEILGDEGSSDESREFAAQWIKRLHSGFDPARGGVAEARFWWTKHANDPETLKQIETLNREPSKHSN